MTQLKMGKTGHIVGFRSLNSVQPHFSKRQRLKQRHPRASTQKNTRQSMDMDSMDAPRLMTTDPLHNQPALFTPEDLVYLRVLLGDASPRSSATEHSTTRHISRQPAAATTLAKDEKQREKYRKRYRNRIVRECITIQARDGLLTNRIALYNS
jgi:hypothetical protein